MMRRGITLVGATTALWILSATAASAHECYNASRSETGNAHAVNGQALVSYDELLGLLCPAGTAIVERAVTANQFATDGHAIDCLPTWFSESIGVAFRDLLQRVTASRGFCRTAPVGPRLGKRTT